MRRFSMIELSIAFIIIVIGVVGIIGLIPSSVEPAKAMHHEEPSQRKKSYKVGEQMCVHIGVWKAESQINGYLQNGWEIKSIAAVDTTLFVIFEKVETNAF